MDKKICFAIKNMKKLKIEYKGTERIIEPHAYGLDKKKCEKLRAFQVSGFSKSSKPSGWKLFKCEDITSIIPLTDSFSVRPGYNYSGDNQISNIKCKI